VKISWPLSSTGRRRRVWHRLYNFTYWL